MNESNTNSKHHHHHRSRQSTHASLPRQSLGGGIPSLQGLPSSTEDAVYESTTGAMYLYRYVSVNPVQGMRLRREQPSLLKGDDDDDDDSEDENTENDDENDAEEVSFFFVFDADAGICRNQRDPPHPPPTQPQQKATQKQKHDTKEDKK